MCFQVREEFLNPILGNGEDAVALSKNVTQAFGEAQAHALVEKQNAFGAGRERVQIIMDLKCQGVLPARSSAAGTGELSRVELTPDASIQVNALSRRWRSITMLAGELLIRSCPRSSRPLPPGRFFCRRQLELPRLD